MKLNTRAHSDHRAPSMMSPPQPAGNGRPRIALFTDTGAGRPNGVTTTLDAVIRHAPPDLDPHVYTLPASDHSAPGYTALASQRIPIPFGNGAQIHAPRLAAMSRCLSRDRAVAIHLTTPGPAALLARRLADRLGLPLLGSYHTELGAYTTRVGRSRSLGVLVQAYLRWLYGACERILVPSEATRTGLIAHGWKPERLALWTRGVDTVMFTPERRSSELRRQWHVSDDRPAILYVGRLSRDTGLELLIPLGDLLDAHRIPYRLVFAGDGPMLGSLRWRFPDAVFTGSIEHSAVGEVMASADLFLFPSETDTAGTVVLEAQACGLPVLVTDRGGSVEQMADGLTGYVCSAGSERDFCWRVAHLVADVERRRALGRAARGLALERTWPDTLRPLFASYRAVIQGREAIAGPHRRPSSRAAAHVS